MNLVEEFSKRVNHLVEGNHFRIKQLSNFIKFYCEDKKAIVDLWSESFASSKDDQPKIMFEVLSDVISTTFYQPFVGEDSYHILFSNLLYDNFDWMVLKFKIKNQIDIVTNLISTWSEKKWGPMKNAIYGEDFTDYLKNILTKHKTNLDDEDYRSQLDQAGKKGYISTKASNFVVNGLKNKFIMDYFILDANDKVLTNQWNSNVNKDSFLALLESQDPNLQNRKKTNAEKFKPIFKIIRQKLMEQLVRREIFIKKLAEKRDKIYQDYVNELTKK